MKHLKLYEEYITPTTTVPEEELTTNSSEPDVERKPQTQEERTRKMDTVLGGVVAQVNLYSDLGQKKMAKQVNINWSVWDKCFNQLGIKFSHMELNRDPSDPEYIQMSEECYEKNNTQNKLTWYLSPDDLQSYFLVEKGSVNKLDRDNLPRLYNKDFSEALINRYLNRNSSGKLVKKQSPNTSVRLPRTFE